MSRIMPQEMEVWYLIPAVRSELTRLLTTKHQLKQKDVAALLGVTEAAISQYRKQKRGRELQFCPEDLNSIDGAATAIIQHPGDVTKILYDLCVQLRGSSTLCALHRKLDSSVTEHCDICKRY